MSQETWFVVVRDSRSVFIRSFICLVSDNKEKFPTTVSEGQTLAQ